jgi:hypothetical protein
MVQWKNDLRKIQHTILTFQKKPARLKMNKRGSGKKQSMIIKKLFFYLHHLNGNFIGYLFTGKNLHYFFELFRKFFKIFF